ncbi:F-box/FBD/LRR-repeat protein [Trifolium repens]|nr:F-box/FBD/LRR-repeat protein [Trifolium repens]
MVRKTKQKKCTLIDAEPDRISCLPGHVTDQILSFLPIEEAVRTSILSSKWRNKWCTIPNLVFDSHYVSADPSIVDHVLLLHSGPINKFEISDDNLIPVISSFSNYIDRWILHLIRRSIKELVLVERYKIPWCLFSYQGLDCLRLYSCWLKPPTTFEGFRNLSRLELYQVIITQVDLEKLISGCPLLESLMLIDIDNIIQLNIHAPNLKDCDILVAFEDINFDNTFQIVTYLAAGVLPVELPTPCICLGDLSFCINFNNLKEISAALCLLRSSPNLQKLEISARFDEETDVLTPTRYSWEDIFSRPTMPFPVRHVTISDISGTTSEFDFIKFLLLYSPMLEKMTVMPVGDVTPELKRALFRLKRASGEAEVVWEEV